MSFNYWQFHENILEDQRLETQLSLRFGGFAKRFEFAVSKQMDARNRYLLTSGRIYLPIKFIEEDKQLSIVASHSHPEEPAYGGIIPWFRRFGLEYVGLNADTDILRMAQVQGVYCLLHLFACGNGHAFVKDNNGGYDAALDSNGVLDPKSIERSRTKKRDKDQKDTEKSMADKAKDAAKKALAADQAAESNPVKKARLEVAAILSGYRKVLVSIAANQRLLESKDEKTAAIKKLAQEAQERREARDARKAAKAAAVPATVAESPEDEARRREERFVKFRSRR